MWRTATCREPLIKEVIQMEAVQSSVIETATPEFDELQPIKIHKLDRLETTGLPTGESNA